MSGSIKVASIAGIGVSLHWTFAALMAWLAISGFVASGSLSKSLISLGFVGTLFGCVVLHELGHALVAKRYGVETRDIILLPIGGVARLERIPERPSQEFWIAIAGPLVNVAIAAAIALMIGKRTGDAVPLGWATRLMWVNLFMAGFNLLPAFPMDGGRVLRALLAMRIGRPRATMLAAKVGQSMAIALGLLGFFQNPMLIFIAIFVYFGAQAEAELVETTSLIQGLRVKDAMMTRFRTLSPEDTLGKAVQELLAGSQQDFPVMRDSTVEGVLQRQDIIKGLSEHNEQTPVAELASGKTTGIGANEPLEGILEIMRRDGCKTVPVFEAGGIVGLLTMENIGELVLVRSARNAHANA